MTCSFRSPFGDMALVWEGGEEIYLINLADPTNVIDYWRIESSEENAEVEMTRVFYELDDAF